MSKADAKDILVVEDQDVVRTMLSALLGARGYRVDAVCDGPAAVERATDVAYAAIVMDLVLPGAFDGVEACRRIRALPEHARTPVLVVSGRQDPTVRARVLAAGADRFFLKPYSAVALLRAIETLVRG